MSTIHPLRITEIFYSLQGESTFVGLPTVFIRLTGCPLRCQYCDTTYAFKGGKHWTVDEILQEVRRYNTPYICVTGGEPLAQPQCLGLLETLCNAGLRVSLETSGALDISQVDPRVVRVMDIKTPDSNESERNLWSNLDSLNQQDQLKFVICSRDDYEWSRQQVKDRNLMDICPVLFSPSHQEVPAADLADWILADQLHVRYQLQLHKVLWQDTPGR